MNRRGPVTLALWLALAAGMAPAQTPFEAAMEAARTGADAQAVALFGQAARAGGAAAQYNLAVLHALGRGTPQNDAEAFYWAWRARLAGEGRAPALSTYLHARLGAEQHAEVAQRLLADLEDLARNGDVTAFLSIGRVQAALVAEPDPKEALAWYTLAAAFDVDFAAALRDSLALEQDRETRAAAQARAQSLFAQWCGILPAEARLASCLQG